MVQDGPLLQEATLQTPQHPSAGNVTCSHGTGNELATVTHGDLDGPLKHPKEPKGLEEEHALWGLTDGKRSSHAGVWREMWGQRWPGGRCDHRHVLSLCVRLCRAPFCVRLHLHKMLQVRERGRFSHPLPGVGFVRQARGQMSSASSEDKSWGTHCAPCPLRASFSRDCAVGSGGEGQEDPPQARN